MARPEQWERQYTGVPSASQPDAPVLLSVIDLHVSSTPSGYLADEGLIDAVNVAIFLQQPLFLSGEPGTGKTQLASALAWELGLPKPLIFETKSTSVARDLFYVYDNLGRFQAARSPDQSIDPKLFIRFNALGLAILRSLEPSVAAEFLPEASELHMEPTRSVVLIDEIDKAPRDLPNDILNEIESLYFRIPELDGAVISANRAFRPLVIITSNSEKSLPDPFLRRCVFYHIPFPEKERLELIVLSRIAGIKDSSHSVLRGVIDFFERLREPASGLRKKPGTAELLNWVNALVALGFDPSIPLEQQPGKVSQSISALAKHPEDSIRIQKLIEAWKDQ